MSSSDSIKEEKTSSSYDEIFESSSDELEKSKEKGKSAADDSSDRITIRLGSDSDSISSSDDEKSKSNEKEKESNKSKPKTTKKLTKQPAKQKTKQKQKKIQPKTFFLTSSADEENKSDENNNEPPKIEIDEDLPTWFPSQYYETVYLIHEFFGKMIPIPSIIIAIHNAYGDVHKAILDLREGKIETNVDLLLKKPKTENPEKCVQYYT